MAASYTSVDLAQHTQLPGSLSGFKREGEPVIPIHNDRHTKRPYYGKCQYKTGKCFNERTLKRNGEPHSLCEEHRIKQNLIQRRSDRKYQTVHAIRRRERSQRRKKQVSTTMAQQLFYEHHQQKALSTPVPQHHPINLPTVNENCTTATPNVCEIVGLVQTIQVPQPPSAFELNDYFGVSSQLMTLYQPHVGCVEMTGAAWGSMLDGSSPTSVDNATLISPLDIPSCPDFPFMPVAPWSGKEQAWSNDDIEFLWALLLA
ncbi:hypothetical protein F444_11911 [Phytophthora nicotianae P1976]|uniref:Uncharacterized protein n=1 Tax=Phytophthora nicotianae P1976 TaxID=1317066 RepID=A0A080ZYX4_PHYNI|nr:hypothetical protein F444_11911 [Phytophthora nicotianae P1976]